MSRQAIAAVLARTDLASGERLVALSLASFAGRENRAWPGAPAASARAGLSRSRYQQARETACRTRPAGCRRARHRPWPSQHRHSPVRRHRSVVGRRHQRRAVRGGAGLQPGPRTRAAAPGDDGCGRGRGRQPCATCRPTQLCAAAGIADRTYRRARSCAARVGPSSSWSAAPAAAGTRTCGWCEIRAQLGDASRCRGRHGAWRRRQARGHWSRRRGSPDAAAAGSGNRRRRRPKRGARIGQLPRETVRS